MANCFRSVSPFQSWNRSPSSPLLIGTADPVLAYDHSYEGALLDRCSSLSPPSEVTSLADSELFDAAASAAMELLTPGLAIHNLSPPFAGTSGHVSEFFEMDTVVGEKSEKGGNSCNADLADIEPTIGFLAPRSDFVMHPHSADSELETNQLCFADHDDDEPSTPEQQRPKQEPDYYSPSPSPIPVHRPIRRMAAPARHYDAIRRPEVVSGHIKKDDKKTRGRPTGSRSNTKMAVYAKQYRDAKKQETAELRVQVDYLEEEMARLRRENERLTEKNASLTRENATLKKANERQERLAAIVLQQQSQNQFFDDQNSYGQY